MAFCDFENQPISYLNLSAAETGTLVKGYTRVSFMNIGGTDALVNGTVLPAGVSITFVASQGNGLQAITYDAQLTNLLITTVG
jgi:hypothetical protein